MLLPATALVVPLAAHDVAGTDREGSVYALLALTTVGALVLAGAGDVLFVVLGVLISSLGAFALVAYRRDDRGSPEVLRVRLGERGGHGFRAHLLVRRDRLDAPG